MGRANLRRAPQAVDLFDQPAARIIALRVGDARVIEPLELVANAPDRSHNRATPRLCWMGGENGMDFEARHELRESFGSELPAQVAHCGCDRLGQRIRPAVAFSDDPRAVVLLRQVGEMEVAGEGAGHELSARERPRRDELLRVALVSPVLARANDQAAQLLHVA